MFEKIKEMFEKHPEEEEAIETTIRRTRRYAKRQMTWFRHQANVDWVDVAPGDSPEKTAGLVQRLWNRHGPAALRL